jgi:hypothetical protein
MVRAGIAASACKPMRALQAPHEENGGRGPPYATFSGGRRFFRIVLVLRRASSCGFHPCFRHVSVTDVLLAGTYWNCLSRIERDGFMDYFHMCAYGLRGHSPAKPMPGTIPEPPENNSAKPARQADVP